jgi:hypothetical protein
MPSASWLADHSQPDQAIVVIGPLADAGDDVAQLWLARWLAWLGQAGELRRRAGAGDHHALMELAEWLARHDRLDELRELILAADGDERRDLSRGWPARTRCTWFAWPRTLATRTPGSG